MPRRRRFLQGISTLPLLAAPTPAATVKRDYFKELGIKPFINAAGTYTTLTASLMQPEVVQAIDYASKQFVHLIELHDAVGQRIATLIGCEAAMVTAGAASALTLGTAACMTGTNQDFIRRLPDTTGMKNEVIIQKSHRYGYDHAVRNCGIRFVEVETRDELERAVSDRTAMMLFLNENDPKGALKAAEWREWEKRVKVVADSVGPIHGVKTETFVPEIANAVPHLRITWDPGAVKITAKEAVKRLREGDPSIELRPGGAPDALEVAVWMLQPGEAQIVARRIREVLKGA